MQISAIATATAAPSPAKVTFTDAAALFRAVDLLGRIIERRATVPILACVLIQPCEGGAMLSATDLDIEATAFVPALWEGAASAAVELSVIASALSAMPRKGYFAPMLHITPAEGAQLDIGQARYRLALGDIDQFPCLSSPDFPLSTELDAATLSADIARLLPSICTEETRYYMQGIHIDGTSDAMTLAATDGHRLAIIDRPNAFAGPIPGMIMPRKFVTEMQRCLAKHDGTVRLELSATRVRASFGNVVIQSKLIDGTFPDFRRVAGQCAGTPAGIWRGEAAALGAAGAAIGKGTGLKAGFLAIDFAPGASRYGSDVGDGFAAPLSGEYQGEPLAVAFSAGLINGAARMAGSDMVTLSLWGDAAPALVTFDSAPELCLIMMPVRRIGAMTAPAALSFMPEWSAPGQAADLWGVTRGFFGARKGKNDTARAANVDECEAYMRDYARRHGHNVDGLAMELLWRGGVCLGATFGQIVRTNEYAPGSFSVPMPGARDALRDAVLLSVLDDATGEWSEYGRCQNGKGEIALPDAKRERKPRGATVKSGSPTPAKRVERVEAMPSPAGAVSLPCALPAPEIEPVAGEGKPQPSADRPRVRFTAADYRARMAMIDATPLSGELARLPVSAETPARAPRAVRERLVRAYLRVRHERDDLAVRHSGARRAAMNNAEKLATLQAAVQGLGNRGGGNIADWLQDDAAIVAMATHLRVAATKRRRAVVLARELGKRLNAEHRLVDKLTAAKREILSDLLAERKEGAVLAAALADATERLEKVTADRTAALVALGEARARPLHLGNEVRPDDIQRLQAMLAQRTAERDEARQANAMREAATALKDGETARAVERMETAMLDATRRALAAENALRAIEARQLRAGASYSMASPAVHWQAAA